jgi:penicillin-binding protein 2
MFDPAKGMEALRPLEEQWGGTAQQRLNQKYRAYAAAAGEAVPPVPERDEDIFDQVEAEARVAARQPEAIAEEASPSRVDARSAEEVSEDTSSARPTSSGSTTQATSADDPE